MFVMCLCVVADSIIITDIAVEPTAAIAITSYTTSQTPVMFLPLLTYDDVYACAGAGVYIGVGVFFVLCCQTVALWCMC